MTKVKKNPLRKTFEKVAHQVLDSDCLKPCILINEYLYDSKEEHWEFNEKKATNKFIDNNADQLFEYARKINYNIFHTMDSVRNLKTLERDFRVWLKLNGFEFIPEDSEAPIWAMESEFGFDKQIVEGVQKIIDIKKKHKKQGYLITCVQIKRKKPILNIFWSKTDKAGFVKGKKLFKKAQLSSGSLRQESNIEKSIESTCGHLQLQLEEAELINYFGYDHYWENRGNHDYFYDLMKKDQKQELKCRC